MAVDAEEFSRHLTAIGDSGSVMAMRQEVVHALDLFGIKSAYFLAPLTRDMRAHRVMTSVGLSWVWEKHYRAGLYRLDPLPQIALEKLAAFCWPDQAQRKLLSAKQRRYLDIVAQHGLARGVAVACFGPDARSGMLAAALPKDAPEPDETMLQQIHALGQVTFQCYCRLIQDNRQIPTLSNRELEVLHWIGKGKSNSVIAAILEISPSSVDVYVRRVFAKLDVSDRTSASVKAYSLGLLVSGDYERFVRESAERGDMEG